MKCNNLCTTWGCVLQKVYWQLFGIVLYLDDNRIQLLTGCAYKQFIEFDSGLAAANFSTVVPQTITLYFYLVICNTLSHNSHYSVYIRITQSLYPVCEYYLCSTVYMYACIHAYIHVCMYICIYVHLARLGKATSSFASTLLLCSCQVIKFWL